MGSVRTHQVAAMRAEIAETLDAPVPRKSPMRVMLDNLYVETRIQEWHRLRVSKLREDQLSEVNAAGVRVNSWDVREYHAARERATKAAETCIRSGVAAAEIKLAQDQAKLLAGVMNRVLQRFRIPLDSPEARTIVRQELEALPYEDKSPFNVDDL